MRALDKHLLDLLERHAARLWQNGEHKDAAGEADARIAVQHSALAERVRQQRKGERDEEAARPVGDGGLRDRGNDRKVSQ